MATSQNGTKFLHFREADNRGNINPRGGLTVAYRSIPAIEGFSGFEGSDTGTFVEFAQAICHENDNFVKALGRAKAGGRLESFKHKSLFVGDEQTFLNHVAAVTDASGLTRKFARKSRRKA